MVKIVVTSDLHLGITSSATIRELVSAIAAVEPALTVLAGDIGEGFPRFVKCLRLFADLPGDVAVLVGNHDIWARGGHSSQDLWERDLPGAVRGAGMRWLEGSVWQHGTVAVAGSLAWYDYSAADPTLPAYRPGFFAGMKLDYNRDAAYVDWPWSDREFAALVGDTLCESLKRLEDDPRVQSIVVVTHVPIFEAQMLRKPGNFHWGFSNAYFGNLTLGKKVAQVRKVRTVVSGHTHIGREGEVKRPEGEPIFTSVLASDYYAPVFTVIDTTTLGNRNGGSTD